MAMLKIRSCIWATLFLVGLAVFGRPALSEDIQVELFAKPIYDPASKRYFALMPSDPYNVAWGSTWGPVEKMARSTVFHGVHGRLAIVDSIEVHDFLLTHFHLDRWQYTWIGLRYLCRQGQLEWSDGSLWKSGSFAAWSRRWMQDVYFCSDTNDPNDWSPVAYSPPPEFRWIGKGRGKGYDWAFVEFPTGQP